jgi:hypothetical protein
MTTGCKIADQEGAYYLTLQVRFDSAQRTLFAKDEP